ncbi:MAG TPA: HAMP domain-containing sensor histidine kinase [Polyangiaceae bacterium]|nr:HAMP domain-containing sensor histidine kinase [Polyangiaceae bacterium]
MESRAQPWRSLAYLTALVAFVMGCVVVRNAVGAFGLPIAGILITPDAVVSDTGLPWWNGVQKGLHFPDRVTRIDGEEIANPAASASRSAVFDRAVARAAAQGREAVQVDLETADGPRKIELGIERLGSVAWWTYGGMLFFAGALYGAAGLIAMAVGRGALARTFAKLALLVCVFLFTLFDFHTTRSLTFLFRISMAMVPMALVGLAFRLPDDLQIVRRLPWLLHALDLTGLALGVTTIAVTSPRIAVPLAAATSALLPLSVFLLTGTVTLRYAMARHRRRDLLRPMLFTLALPQVIIASTFFTHGPVRTLASIIAFPALALTPLATMVAFVRHDVWKSRILLSRYLTRAVIAAIVCLLAMGIGTAIAGGLGVPFANAIVAASAGAIAAALLVLVALRAGDKAFFPSLADYKPTVEQLSEELTSIASPNEVVLAVERTVRRWLPCDTIEFVLGEEFSNLDPSQVMGSDESGAHKISVLTPSTFDSDELSLPVLFHGTKLGTLRASQKRSGALFTSEDLDLLKTIANQGALALAHAVAYAELEKRRKQQAAAWRDEREALVETLSAEIAHEVRYPINFFRSIFQRASTSRILDEEDVEIGCEEVDRLERLVTGLRRMATQHLDKHATDVHELCARTEVLLRDRMGGHPLTLDLGEGGAIRCDVDKVTQVLVNLLANALDAIEGRGHVGISFRSVAHGAELSVWDTGPGFVGDPSRLFAPWYTTKPRGTGLGLAITYRLVRAHGWNVEATRRDAKTIFVVAIPSADVASGTDDLSPNKESGEIATMPSSEKGEVA